MKKSRKQRRFERRLAKRRDREYTMMVGKIARQGLRDARLIHFAQ